MALSNDGLFSLKTVPASVEQELKSRAQKKWNPSLGQAKTWMSIRSMAQGKPYPIQSYETFNQAYDEYNRPKALVQSIEVSAKGEYGTTRSAKVNLLVFNETELDTIADSYFIPDMSVRVEFGWSVTSAGLLSAKTISTGVTLDGDAIKAIQEQSESQPCYDGFQGRVVNWSIMLRPAENVWDITLELIGAAASIANTTVSTPSDKCKCEQQVVGNNSEKPEDKNKVTQESSNLRAALLELWDTPEYISSIKSSLGGSGEFYAEKIQYPGYDRDETGVEDSDTYMMGLVSSDLDAEETFISWGTVETLLSRMSGQLWSEGNPAGFELNSKGLTLNVPKQRGSRWFSCDPRVCMLPGGGLAFKEPAEWFDYVSVVGAVSSYFFDTPPSTVFGQGNYGKSTSDCFADDNTIRLTDILVSTIHLMKRVKEFEQNKVTFMQGVKTLLNDINTACGGVWDFEIIDVTGQTGADTKSAVRLAIIDVDTHGVTKAQPFTFLATPENGGFCRDIKLDLKPTDAMKTQALYGANKSGDKYIPPGTACQGRFVMYTRDLAVNLGKKSNTEENKSDSHCNGGTKCNPSNEEDDPVELLSKKVIESTVQGARTFLEKQKQDYEKQVAGGSASKYCSQFILPMNFSATLTGIGGFRWGQAVTCDRIPRVMREKILYQVTTVEHKVTPDDWTTTVNTVARYVG